MNGQVASNFLKVLNVMAQGEDKLIGFVAGAKSFNRKSLHHLGNTPNPYEQAITIIGRTLAAFDEDNLIPCYGFGDGNHCFIPT